MADKLIFEVVAEGKNLKVVQKDTGKLADIAPTILNYLNIPIKSYRSIKLISIKI